MKYQFADQMKWPKEYASAKCWQMSSSFTNNTKLYYTLESVYPESTKVNARSKFDPFWPLYSYTSSSFWTVIDLVIQFEF